MAVYHSPGKDSGSGSVMAEQFRLSAREHTRYLLPMVDQVLVQAGLALSDMDACAYGRGPGSFTGLRIALGAIQGLAFGAQLPVVPVSSLAGLAQSWVDACESPLAEELTILAAIDARMNEVYWAEFTLKQGLVVAGSEERLTSPQALWAYAATVPGEVVGAGSGWGLREDGMSEQLLSTATECLPRAASIARLAGEILSQGGQIRPEKALPRYLRDQVAWQKSP